MGKRCDAIIANSSEGYEYWKKTLNCDNVFRIQNIISFHELNEIKPKNNRTHKFALVSRLDKNKNVKQFFESLIPFIPSLKENDVLVVGDGPERKRLENFACKNNLQKIVKFVGFRKDANYFMASSECFVSLSLAEGQPNAVLEALALKKKMLLSDIPAHKELADFGNIAFVDPHSRDSIQTGLKNMLKPKVGTANSQNHLQTENTFF